MYMCMYTHTRAHTQTHTHLQLFVTKSFTSQCVSVRLYLHMAGVLVDALIDTLYAFQHNTCHAHVHTEMCA